MFNNTAINGKSTDEHAKDNNNNINSIKNDSKIMPLRSSEHIHRVFSVDDAPDEINGGIKSLESLINPADKLQQAEFKSNNDLILPSTDQLNALSHAESTNIDTINTNSSSRRVSRMNSVESIKNNSHYLIDSNKPRVTSRFSFDSSPLVDPNYALLKENNRLSGSNELDNLRIHRINSNGVNIQEDLSKALNTDNRNTQEEDYLGVNDNVNLHTDRISTTSSLESYTLRERQAAINETHPFGIRIWKPALYKKKRSVEEAADQDIHETKLKRLSWFVHCSNILWALTFGLLLFTLCLIAGLSVIAFGLFAKSSREYSNVLFQLAHYLLWPYGKIVYLIQDDRYSEEDNNEGISVQQFYSWITSYSKIFTNQPSETENLNQGCHSHSYQSLHDINALNHPSYGSIQQYISHQQNDHGFNSRTLPMAANSKAEDDEESENVIQRRYFGRGKWTLGRFLFYYFFYVAIQPIVFLISLVTWLFVFTIPISNILWKLMYHCRRHPLALGFKNIKSKVSEDNPIVDSDNNKSILLCTFRCVGWHYYKYTVNGTNVIVVNLISFVFFTIFDFYVIKRMWEFDIWCTNESTIFVFCLISIIPLAFYIGQAVASISAQTSMGVGAAINAFFSTVVEIFLYCVALQQGKGLLVEGSMIGSILGAVLLLPGLSMCGGALKRKTQRYNPASAGVSSALLIFSMIVMFVPTILYEIYGGYVVTCENEDPRPLSISIFSMAITSERCYFSHPPLKFNKLYKQVIQPMSISCAIVLFLAYIIGLWFTLRTHAKMIWQLPISEPSKDATLGQGQEIPTNNETNVDPDGSGHTSPNWSRSKSTWILLVATLLYAVIAEILVSCVDSILEDFPSLNPKFLGLTIFALVPNTTEFLNAISFAIHGNVALSMEIGSAYALQVCLIQIPSLVLYSIYHTWNVDHSLINIRNEMFPLVFPRWDLVGAMASVFLFTYLYAEGKSNYFKGSMLILLYIIITIGFYFQGVIDSGRLT